MIIIQIIINIPSEFEIDFNTDKFEDFFSRVAADIDCDGLCGNYEKEIAEMFKEAFENSNIVQEHNYDNCHNYTCRKQCKEDGYREGYNKAISEFSEALRLECLDSCFKEVHLYTILKMADKMRGGE